MTRKNPSKPLNHCVFGKVLTTGEKPKESDQFCTLLLLLFHPSIVACIVYRDPFFCSLFINKYSTTNSSVKETITNDWGGEETVQRIKPAPTQMYSKQDVFVPPVLAKWLRPHQREGMQFMYECVMGLKDFRGYGCILADDMGCVQYL